MPITGINIDVGKLIGGLGKVGQLFKDIRAAITGKEILDPTKEAEIQAKILEIESILTTSQTEINKIEAQHPSIFIAGWRPWIGWVCGISLAWHFVACPMTIWVAEIFGKTLTPPSIEVGLLINIVLAMLGLGGLRTFEKYKGVENNR